MHLPDTVVSIKSHCAANNRLLEVPACRLKRFTGSFAGHFNYVCSEISFLERTWRDQDKISFSRYLGNRLVSIPRSRLNTEQKGRQTSSDNNIIEIDASQAGGVLKYIIFKISLYFRRLNWCFLTCSERLKMQVWGTDIYHVFRIEPRWFVLGIQKASKRQWASETI